MSDVMNGVHYLHHRNIGDILILKKYNIIYIFIVTTSIK